MYPWQILCVSDEYEIDHGSIPDRGCNFMLNVYITAPKSHLACDSKCAKKWFAEENVQTEKSAIDTQENVCWT